MNRRRITKYCKAFALLLAAALALSACGGGGRPQPTPAATEPVAMGQGSFASGTGMELGFRLLYGLDSLGGNGALGTAGIIGCLTAAETGAAGDTDDAFTTAMGTEEMAPKQVTEIALRLRQALGRLTQGRYATAWSLYVGEQQAIKESFLSDCDQSLQMEAVFQQLDNQTGKERLGEWADESTGGRMKKLVVHIPEEKAPFFVDVTLADPDWQTALDTGKTRPLPFTYEDGQEKAIPTMVCLQKCGIYDGPEGAMAILPTAGDEARLIVMMPPAETSLHDFIPVAAARHDEWMAKAEWKMQRVLLPRFQISYEDSLLKVLEKSGFAGLFAKGTDYSNMGAGLYFADILHKATLIVDESGVDSPDPSASYRPGNKDDITTLAIDRPFLVALEKTDGLQVLAMGVVRDPLTATVGGD